MLEYIPAYWKVVKLKRVAKLNPACKFHGIKPEDEVTFSPMECVRTDKRIELNATLSKNNSSYSQFNEGDIALAKVTPCFENGNVCIMENLTRGYAFGSSELFNIRPFNIKPRYLLYYLMTDFFKNGGIANMTGSAGLKRVPATYIQNALVPVPPLAEQEAIVKFLDYEVSRIEKLILIRERQIVNLKELKKAVINEAVTKGDWKRVRLKRLFKIFSGATPKSDNPQYWDGNIIWITPADFQTHDKYIYDGAKNITKTGFKSCSTSLIPAGSIIFSKRAPVGKVAINKIALCTNQGCLSCVPLENISSEFFYYVMSICQEEFEKEAAGTTFKEISLTAFANFLLPAPSIAEQNEIAKYLDKKCTQIDKLITIREKQITELNELKARLISDAVTGKIDVR